MMSPENLYETLTNVVQQLINSENDRSLGNRIQNIVKRKVFGIRNFEFLSFNNDSNGQIF